MAAGLRPPRAKRQRPGAAGALPPCPAAAREARPARDRARAQRAGQRAAGAGIDGPVRPVRRRWPTRGDVGAGAEARIEQARAAQRVQRRAVVRQVRRLHAHRAVPIEAEPGRSSTIAGRVFRPAAAGIDVLQPQQEAPARLARPPPGEQRRMGVAEMQKPGRAGREARDDGHAEGRALRTDAGKAHGRLTAALGQPGGTRAATRRAVPRPRRRRARPDRPRRRLGARAAGRALRRARTRRTRTTWRRSGRQWFSLADRTPPCSTPVRAAPRRGSGHVIDAELARLGLPADAYRADGLQPGRDDGAVRRAAPRAAAARRSSPFPARCSIAPSAAAGDCQPPAGPAGAWRGGRCRAVRAWPGDAESRLRSVGRAGADTLATAASATASTTPGWPPGRCSCSAPSPR